MSEWTRDDLPSLGDLQIMGLGYSSNDNAAAKVVLDTVVEHLNVKHPKLEDGFFALPDSEWSRRAALADEARIEANILRNRAIRERDAAVARAEQAEKRGDNWEQRAHDWMKLAEQRPGFSLDDLRDALRSSVRTLSDDELAMQGRDVWALLHPEQSVDPAEAKAKELYDVANPDTARSWDQVPNSGQDHYRLLARHVLGQEADQ